MPLTRPSNAAPSLLVPQTRIDSSTPGCVTNAVVPGAPTGAAITASIIELSPLYVPQRCTFNQVTIRAGTAGFDSAVTTPQVFNLGIYGIADGLPGPLLAAYNGLQFLPTTTSNAFMNFSLSPSVTLDEGLHWIAFHLTSTPFSFTLASTASATTDNRPSFDTLLMQKMLGYSGSSTSSFNGLQILRNSATVLPTSSEMLSRTLSFLTSSPSNTLNFRVRADAIMYRFSYV